MQFPYKLSVAKLFWVDHCSMAASFVGARKCCFFLFHINTCHLFQQLQETPSAPPCTQRGQLHVKLHWYWAISPAMSCSCTEFDVFNVETRPSCSVQHRYFICARNSVTKYYYLFLKHHPWTSHWVKDLKVLNRLMCISQQCVIIPGQCY